MFRSFLALRRIYPYNTFRGTWAYLQFLLLFLAPSWTFRKMSIVPLVKKAYKLEHQKEFLTRYYASRIGFEDQWASRPRTTQADIESFYLEHDKDIWRQAYLSDGKYNYKKKILRVYHLVEAEHLPHDAPIIDYGGGAGVVVHYLSRKGYTAVDIADIPSKTIEFVRKTMSGFLRNVITLDGSEQLGKDHYAVIICTDVLEHTPSPLAVTKSFLTALRTRGLLIVSFPKEHDFSGAHLESAQKERDAVFQLLEQTCDVVVPNFAYRKRS